MPRLRCLVLTNDRACRDTLRLAATLRGWPQREGRLAHRGSDDVPPSAAADFDLVFVDLRHLVGTARCRAWEVVACCAGCPAKLVAVCGSAADPRDEQWARELGASLYLADTSVSTAFECVSRHLAGCWPGPTAATPRHPGENADARRAAETES